jgi:hypothetical protein
MSYTENDQRTIWVRVGSLILKQGFEPSAVMSFWARRGPTLHLSPASQCAELANLFLVSQPHQIPAQQPWWIFLHCPCMKLFDMDLVVNQCLKSSWPSNAEPGIIVAFRLVSPHTSNILKWRVSSPITISHVSSYWASSVDHFYTRSVRPQRRSQQTRVFL